MKILILSDAWHPQINGVVRTLEATRDELVKMGHVVQIIGPDGSRFFAFPIPFYRQVTLEFFARYRVAKIMRSFAPDVVHLATEGPIGWAGRTICLKNRTPFTTSYHTSFPAYVAKRSPRSLKPLMTDVAFAVLRRFHAPSAAVMVPTLALEKELAARGFHRLVLWGRGVDSERFNLYDKDIEAYRNLPRPILLNVGRVAVEKNLRAFLKLKTPGTKVVIGDGPDLKALQAAFPGVHFLGSMSGERLARHYAAADLFVFPSKTDTYGLVLLEAAASGLRIACYPIGGPRDIFADAGARRFAVLSHNLQYAVDRALALPDNPQIPRAYAARFSWAECTKQFVKHLQAPLPERHRRPRWRRKMGEGI